MDVVMATCPDLEVIPCGPQTLALRGELCIASVDLFTDALARITGAVTLDLSELRFMDSTGLKVLVKRLSEGPVTLDEVSPQLVRLLALTGVDQAEGLEIRSRS